MSTVSVPKSKPCNRCGEAIVWNNQGSFFESLKFPKFQHCCPIKCNTEGCGGTIYFSKLCPINPQTGKQRPLDHPIPVIDPNNSAQMIWKLHVHLNKSTVPATETPAQPPVTTVPETKPLAEGQETLSYTPTVEETKVAVQKVQESTIPATGGTGETANQDVNGAIIKSLNDINLRLGGLEKYFNDVVPVVTGLIETMNNIVPKLNVITGKIADGSITSASDLVKHNLSEREEKNLQ